MNIQIANRQETIAINESNMQQAVSAILSLENVRCDEVGVHCVDIAEISHLHGHYFDDTSPTDCISFPIDTEDNEGYRVLGEVFLCPQTALAYTQEHGGNPQEELYLYLIHGLLHLIGYNDISDNDRQQMREAEQRHLENLKQLSLL